MWLNSILWHQWTYWREAVSIVCWNVSCVKRPNPQAGLTHSVCLPLPRRPVLRGRPRRLWRPVPQHRVLLHHQEQLVLRARDEQPKTPCWSHLCRRWAPLGWPGSCGRPPCSGGRPLSEHWSRVVPLQVVIGHRNYVHKAWIRSIQQGCTIYCV